MVAYYSLSSIGVACKSDYMSGCYNLCKTLHSETKTIKLVYVLFKV